MPFFLPVNPMTYNVQKAAWRKLKYFSSTASLFMSNPLRSSHPPANTSSSRTFQLRTICQLNSPMLWTTTFEAAIQTFFKCASSRLLLRWSRLIFMFLVIPLGRWLGFSPRPKSRTWIRWDMANTCSASSKFSSVTTSVGISRHLMRSDCHFNLDKNIHWPNLW